MKMGIAIDTGALISLQLSGLLKKSFKYFSFFIGNVIKGELEDMEKTRDNIGIAANDTLKLVSAGNIRLVEIPKEKTGEVEALKVMKKQGCDFLVSDDIKFVMKTQKKFENVHFSVFIIYVLYELGDITKEEAIESVDKIFKKRSWSENLISLFAKEAFK